MIGNGFVYDRVGYDVMVKAKELLSEQTFLPWQAVIGKRYEEKISLPVAFIIAELLITGKGDGGLLKKESLRTCKKWNTSTPPDNTDEYNLAIKSMFDYPCKVAIYIKLISEENDLLWQHLLDQNRKMATDPGDKNGMTKVNDFFGKEILFARTK